MKVLITVLLFIVSVKDTVGSQQPGIKDGAKLVEFQNKWYVVDSGKAIDDTGALKKCPKNYKSKQVKTVT